MSEQENNITQENIEEATTDTFNINGQDYTRDQVMDYGKNLIEKSGTLEGVAHLHNTFKAEYERLNPNTVQAAPEAKLKEMTGDAQADVLILAENMETMMKQNTSLKQELTGALRNVSSEMKGYVDSMSNTSSRQSIAEVSADTLGAELNIPLSTAQVNAYMNETGLPAKEAVFAKRGNDIIKGASGNRIAPKMLGTSGKPESLNISSDDKLSPREIIDLRQTNPEALDQYLNARNSQKTTSKIKESESG